jgi:DNA repair protein RecN (Recombination protein N)
MLRRIQIKDFAIIDNLELELQSGMTVITGETGAGKSIVIDALDIALGERADNKMVRHGAERCEIILEFELQHIPQARAWLEEMDLASDDNTCILRRILATGDSRSRNYINGSIATLQQLRDLGSLLVHVHGQHQHQALIKRDEQRILLDQYAAHPRLLEQVKTLYQQWRDIRKTIESLQQAKQNASQLALLRYQAEELSQLNLQADELETLHHEHKQLTHAEQLLFQAQEVLLTLADDNETNALKLIHHVMQRLENMKALSPQLGNACHSLKNAVIEISEVENELRDYIETVEISPERLSAVEQRLTQIHNIARKHKVAAEQLVNYQAELETAVAALQDNSTKLADLVAQEQALLVDYQKAAEKLHISREKAAQKLNALITENIQQLGMPNGQFSIEIVKTAADAPTVHGLDKIDFLVSANPGQPLQPLAKVASGGELSRISLAIQVITAQADATPTLVFDEVDVGIGGGTAEIVGVLLRKLGQQAQVLCITHLPQVAAQGHQHLRIFKETHGSTTRSYIHFLDDTARIEEIARMLGGVKMTQQSLAHAREMLSEVGI